MEYTEIKYVDAIYGSDEFGDGSMYTPYQTIQFCVSKLITANPLVYIANGNYRLDNFFELQKKNMIITYIGSGVNTILNVFRNVRHDSSISSIILYSCVITPSEDSTMSVLVAQGKYVGVGKTNDIFYNVVFLKRGTYPSTFFSAEENSGVISMNYAFYNCSFIGSPYRYKFQMTFNDCATTHSLPSIMLSNCIFNEDFFITDDTGAAIETNNTYGVYSGEYAWTAFLLRQNGKYYSIYNSLYNSEKSEYEPLINPDFKYKFNASRLFNEITINEETFKPIDKFDNFSIVLPVVRANNAVKLNGIKSNKELIVQTFDINTTLVKNIINLILNVPKGDVKLVFSKDMGESWLTIIDNEIVITDCIIPRKRYEDFTNDDLVRFNSARETISEIGFSQEVLSSFNFNKTDIERLRFAYVLSTDDYISNPLIEDLTINYDEKGYLQEMKDTECDIEIFEHTVKVTSKIDNPRIETNIIV